jgi:hypothetical protein
MTEILKQYTDNAAKTAEKEHACTHYCEETYSLSVIYNGFSAIT